MALIFCFSWQQQCSSNQGSVLEMSRSQLAVVALQKKLNGSENNGRSFMIRVIRMRSNEQNHEPHIGSLDYFFHF